MGFENKYPYTDFHELNLDWILNQMKALAEAWDAYQEQLTGTNGEWPTFKNYIETSWATYQANLTGPTGEWPTFKAAMEQAWNDYQESLTGTNGEWPTFKTTMESEWQQFFDTYLQTLGVVQVTGQSATDVMSQKAVTDALNGCMRGAGFITNQTVTTDTNDLNKLKNNTVTLFYVSSSYVANMPSALGATQQIFFVKTSSYQATTSYCYQLLYAASNNTMYYRFNNNNTWSSWEKIVKQTDINNSIAKYMYGDGFYTNQSVTSDTNDLNKLKANTINMYYVTSNYVANMPDEIADTSIKLFYITTYSYNTLGVYSYQILYCVTNGIIYYRNCNNNTWSNWNKFLNSDDTNKIDEKLDYSYLRTELIEPFEITETSMTVAGDSIMVGVTSPGSVTNLNFPYNLMNLLQITNVNNIAVSGACFSYHSGYGQIITQITNGTLKEMLIIAAGVNDWVLNTPKADFTSAVQNVMTWLTNNYTGKVIFITPINNVITASHTNPLDWYREELTRLAITNGYSVIAGNEIGFPTKAGDMSSLLLGDNVHPSETGYKVYANKVYSIIK